MSIRHGKGPGINRGNLVEFTDKPYASYPPEDQSLIRFGVALEDVPDVSRGVLVRTASGDVRAQHVHAYAWLGWCPEDLEEIYEQLNPGDPEEEW